MVMRTGLPQGVMTPWREILMEVLPMTNSPAATGNWGRPWPLIHPKKSLLAVGKPDATDFSESNRGRTSGRTPS